MYRAQFDYVVAGSHKIVGYNNIVTSVGARQNGVTQAERVAVLVDVISESVGGMNQSGQERLKNIRRQIEDLQREEQREARGDERARLEENIRAQIAANDANRKLAIEDIENQREAIKEKYEMMKDAAAKLAEQTQIGLMDAGEVLAEGLQNMYEELDKNIDTLSANQLQKVKHMATNIMQMLAQVQTAFAQLGFATGGTNISNTDNSRNLTLHSVNNFHGNDQRGMSQAWQEEFDIAFRHLNLRV